MSSTPSKGDNTYVRASAHTYIRTYVHIQICAYAHTNTHAHTAHTNLSMPSEQAPTSSRPGLECRATRPRPSDQQRESWVLRSHAAGVCERPPRLVARLRILIPNHTPSTKAQSKPPLLHYPWQVAPDRPPTLYEVGLPGTLVTKSLQRVGQTASAPSAISPICKLQALHAA